MSKERIEQIKSYAFDKHKDQKYGTEEYSVHLRAVNQVIRRFGYEFSSPDLETLLECSWLHDTLEDTEATVEELKTLFGDVVAKTVHDVSDEPGKNRKERKAKTYPKIAANDLAIALKLADRIANVENCITTKSSLFSMYIKEHREFKKYLDNGRYKAMWAHLDGLLNANI